MKQNKEITDKQILTAIREVLYRQVSTERLIVLNKQVMEDLSLGFGEYSRVSKLMRQELGDIGAEIKEVG